MQSIQMADFDRDALRTRLRKMSDEELREFGKAARYMVSPGANMGKPPLPTFVLQLEKARAEWRRRHPPPRLTRAIDQPCNAHRTTECPTSGSQRFLQARIVLTLALAERALAERTPFPTNVRLDRSHCCELYRR